MPRPPGALTQKRSLQDNLDDTLRRYALEMNHHNSIVQGLEAELGNVHDQVTRQGAEYQALLNIKVKLEEEIANYHRLLEATGVEDGGVIETGVREGGNVQGPGAREDDYVKAGDGVRDDVNIKDGDKHQDAHISGPGKNEVASFDATADDPDEGLPDGECVEFSLEQALNAARPCPIPDTSPAVRDDVIEENLAPLTQSEAVTVSLSIERKEDGDTEERREVEEEKIISDENAKIMYQEKEVVPENQEEAGQEEAGLVKLGAEIPQAPPLPDTKNGDISDDIIEEKAASETETETITLSLTVENKGEEERENGEKREEEAAEVIQHEPIYSKAVEMMENKGEVQQEEEIVQQLETEISLDEK